MNKKERWDVECVFKRDNVLVDLRQFVVSPGADPELSRKAAHRAAADARARGWSTTITHVVTRKYEYVYSWRASKELNTWWFDGIYVGSALRRDIYVDPLGKYSRKRAKAGALANKPPGACTLVAVRRRVKG